MLSIENLKNHTVAALLQVIKSDLNVTQGKSINQQNAHLSRDGFKTQPAVDRPEPAILAGCHCSEQ